VIRHRSCFVAGALLLFLILPVFANGQAKEGAWSKKKSPWVSLSPAERGQVQDFSEDYKQYLDVARSALGSTKEVTRRAKATGFVEFSKPEQVKPGARLIIPNRERSLILAVIGSEPIIEGSRVVGTHQDSPHIELKGRPILAAGDFAMFKTIYYGGIKKYQWANRPLALIGRVDTTDGRTIDVAIGMHPGEPVFVIPDNAPHSDQELRKRSSSMSFAAKNSSQLSAVFQVRTAQRQLRSQSC
jgi:aspartyl aminopeptidase